MKYLNYHNIKFPTHTYIFSVYMQYGKKGKVLEFKYILNEELFRELKTERFLNETIKI